MATNPVFRLTYNRDTSEKFRFVRPPEAPVFEPTMEEFKDPIAYIQKIRGKAEKAGICKIKPPSDWQPPFAVDVDKFKFTPRVQKLNELEAITRVKMNFAESVFKYWALQGIKLVIPVVHEKTLDLHALYHLVLENGGVEKLDADRKWGLIIQNLNSGFMLPQILRAHYMKILRPYHIFQEKLDQESKKRESERNGWETNKKAKTEAGEVKKENPSVVADTWSEDKKFTVEKKEPKIENFDDADVENQAPTTRELARLAFFGAGPKLPGYDPTKKSSETKTRGRRINYQFDPLEKYMCKSCKRGDTEELMLRCDGCEDSYHTHCLVPPLLQVPAGDWQCPSCAAFELGKPLEAFGFAQASCEYTLCQFGQMADQFKADYFDMEASAVPTEVVEREFWRIVSCIDEDVTVQYGADLHTVDHGSGFPTAVENDESMSLEREYEISPWNLNNLPVSQGSVLQYIESEISGMKIPWMYVGMCFATFCWHNEDHWNYSINYLHLGEPKTWYGVPGSEAQLLESVMLKLTPELFQNQPDLLQQLTTIMNPNLLMDNEVSVVRTDQKAGEFVVTFPRAYHAGFNQGFNFAEAVNFAPADWISKGRECVEHYALQRRLCVFSHDELIVHIAQRANDLTKDVAIATANDMAIMLKTEEALRSKVKQAGIQNEISFRLEDLPDEERACEICNTTCYLSCVLCKCEGKRKIACLKHISELCFKSPEHHIFQYRFHLSALYEIYNKLKERAEGI